MVTKETLQNFIDEHVDEIGQILPGGLKNKAGKWILVCPIMERFNLDFSKVKIEVPVEEVSIADATPATTEEVVEEVVEDKKPAKGKGKSSKGKKKK